ncbi:phosphoheptose isomerase [Actinomadura rubrobrunea]|uniref:Phosphoheptose isomerase n=1 Tax=Actinomadura rubrobrunea TaxID=115335 RepID=A0A9W6PXL3_9ACTN|nr:SIS domain-containing protein [Actinomadura rubrobrunea]GLW64914.1 phosphoheptose isomerase [Actinomadura rubrobrunea]
MTAPDHAGDAADMETLYPFLYAGGTRADALLEDARRSAEAKAAEIAALRADLADRHGEALRRCARRMAEAFRAGGRLLTFGNGGSSTDAQAVARLFAGPPPPAPPLPAISLPHDVATLTALSNDVGFEVVFARRLAALGRPGDIALGLSTSGGSRNLLRAFDEAARRGMVTVGFAGYDGGAMAEAGTVDHLFVVPSSSVHRIQEAQTTVYHVLWELTVRALEGAP